MASGTAHQPLLRTIQSLSPLRNYSVHIGIHRKGIGVAPSKFRDHYPLKWVTAASNPLSPKRQIELEKALVGCSARKVYISAFPDFREFKRHIDNIAWETEVWIEANPVHMIHFNGPKFLTVYE